MIPAAGTRVRLYTRVPFEIYLDSLVEVLHDDDDMGRRSAVCTGALCETALDPCAGVFCGEHGTCRATKIGQYVGLGLGLLRVRWRLERPAVPPDVPRLRRPKWETMPSWIPPGGHESASMSAFRI